jgi:hypothetical protein
LDDRGGICETGGLYHHSVKFTAPMALHPKKVMFL